jgi:hypothetical protein
VGNKNAKKKQDEDRVKKFEFARGQDFFCVAVAGSHSYHSTESNALTMHGDLSAKPKPSPRRLLTL